MTLAWPEYNFAAGPVEVSARTLRDISRPVMYHYDPAFIELFARTESMLKQVYRTEYDVVLMQGEALLGLEAAAASLIRPGDKVLNLVSGIFGKWFEDFIARNGGETIEVTVPYNESIDPDDVRKALHANPGIKYLSAVHSETPSGTINPIREIGRIAHEFGVITMVDTVSGLGSELMSPEDWGIDIAIAGPQKCLSGTPGLALLSVSPAAWEAMESAERPLRGSYLSILDWKSTWLEKHTFPYTPLVSEMYSMESVLTQVLEEGVESLVNRHQQIAAACRAGVKALGLTLWPARESIAAPCVTAITMPDGITDAQIRGTMRDKYGVMISPGYGQLGGQLVRLSHMGEQARPGMLATQLAVFERALVDVGMKIEPGVGVGAAMAALNWPDA
jgi:pyridoxamine--pyruvate transaminase